MANSSINFQKASAGSFKHNDRTISPDYLIDDSSKNECNRSSADAKITHERLYGIAKSAYELTYGQKFQTNFKNTHWEAVVNLNANHTLKDVEALAKAIEKETGFTAIQVSIHRDEGKDKENKNYHAHINFFTCDLNTGKQLYRLSVSNSEREKIRKEHNIPEGEKIPAPLVAVMDRAKLSKLQDLTAETLMMKRGQKGSKAVRLEHKAYKQKIKEEAAAAKNPETDFYDFRAIQKKITALETENVELKKELHKLNTEANKTKDQEKIKALEAKIQELQISNKAKTTEQRIAELEIDSEIMSIKNQARHEEMRASFAEPPSAYEVFSKLTADKDTLDKKEIEKIKKELKAHDRNVKDFAKKIIEGFKSTKTALFSILDKIKGNDRDNVIKSKIEGKESQIEAYTESKEVKNEEALKAFVEAHDDAIHAHTPSKLG